MKKVKLRSIVAALLVVVMGMLSGCGAAKFDAGAYTKCCLDAMYKGEFDEYIKMTEISKEEAQSDYDESIETIMDEFEELGLSDDLLAQYRQFFVDVLKKTKYTIKEVKEDKDKNYTVNVEIEPIQIFAGIGEETMLEVQKYMEELAAAGGEMPTEEEISEKCSQIIYDLLVKKMDNLTYGEKQVVTIKVTKSDDNVYEISETDYKKMDEKMFDIDELKFE